MNDEFDRDDKIETLADIVRRDYRRVQNADDPFLVLDVPPDSSFDEIKDEFERYERFYSAEQFDDLDRESIRDKRDYLLQKFEEAFDQIRKRFSANQSVLNRPEGEDTGEEGLALSVTEEGVERDILADTYFKDGITYHAIGDLESAQSALQKSLEYGSNRPAVEAFSTVIEVERGESDQNALQNQVDKLSEIDSSGTDRIDAVEILLEARLEDDISPETAESRLERIAPDPIVEAHVKRQIEGAE